MTKSVRRRQSQQVLHPVESSLRNLTLLAPPRILVKFSVQERFPQVKLERSRVEVHRAALGWLYVLFIS